MQLEPIHFRAIGSLAFGMSVADVAKDCDSSTSAIHRWMDDPVFLATLELEVRKRQSAMPIQIQIVATESVEGQVDSERELRAFALGAKDPEYPRVLALMTLKKFGQRWLDLAGFDPKLKEKAAKLAFQKPRNPLAVDCPDKDPSREECGPGDRKNRPKSEQDPPPAFHGARTIEDFADFARAGRLERGLGTAREIEDAREAREYAECAERKGSGDRGQGSEQNGNRADADHGAQASCLPRVSDGQTSAEVPERTGVTDAPAGPIAGSSAPLAEGTSNRSEISAVTNTNGCAPGGSSSSSNANPDEKQEKQEKPKQNA